MSMSEQVTQAEQGTPAVQIESNTQPSSVDASHATEIESSNCTRKRKPIEPRSQVWTEFTKFKDQKGNEKARCNFCGKEFFADTNRNGTSNLKAHMKKCKGKEEKKQALISFEQGSVGENTSTIGSWRFDSDAIRKGLSCMIILDELPFSFVEGEGFKQFVSIACPRFRIPSRSTITRDCFVPTRWNSTYLMLDVALKFQKVFETYAKQDHNFISDLANEGGEMGQNGKGIGAPTESDWKNAEKIAVFLKHFYILTNRVSGSFYVTANVFFREITNVECLLQSLKGSNDKELSAMAERMAEKYNKYWGNIEKANSLIYVADILDPRHKLEFMEWALEDLYEKNKSEKMIKKIKDDLVLLFDEYKRLYGSILNNKRCNNGTTSELNLGKEDTETQVMDSRFKRHKSETNAGESKSELEKYLKEDLENDVSDFNILGWWKVNASRFPILSHLARDALAVPVSTVASESTFSTSGRILDAFRSSLTPRISEALICAQDWLRSTFPIGVEENLELLDQLEQEFSKVELDSAAPTNN